jgi:biotin synthase
MLKGKASTALRPFMSRSFASAVDSPLSARKTKLMALHRLLSRGFAVEAASPVKARWRREDIQTLYDSPLLDLIFRAASVHRQFHDPQKIQLCTLLNIKEGGCTEDCSYCAQSSRHSTGLKASKLLDIEPVLK